MIKAVKSFEERYNDFSEKTGCENVERFSKDIFKKKFKEFVAQKRGERVE